MSNLSGLKQLLKRNFNGIYDNNNIRLVYKKYYNQAKANYNINSINNNIN